MQKYAVAAIIPSPDFRQIMLLQNSDKHPRHPKMYSTPGGKVDFMEPAYEALSREIMEEIGCKVSAYKQLGWTNYESYFDGTTTQYIVLFYMTILKDFGVSAIIREPDKHSKFIFANKDLLVSMCKRGLLMPGLTTWMNTKGVNSIFDGFVAAT